MLRNLLCSGCLLAVAVSTTPIIAQHSAAITHLPTMSDQAPLAACTDARILISGPAEGDRKLACEGARQAVELLGRCGVSLHRPLRLEIAEQINHPFGRPVLGFFDAME